MTVGTTHGRGASLAARLSRAGVADVPRGERLLTDRALLAVWPQAPDDLPELLGAVADPDQALLTLAKVAGAVGPHPDLTEALVAAVMEAGPARERLLSLAGASAALGDVVVARPESLRVVLDDSPGVDVDASSVRAGPRRRPGRCAGGRRDASGLPPAPARHRRGGRHQP